MAIRLKSTITKLGKMFLEEHGFQFNKTISNSSEWVFTRQVDNVEQHVRFQKSNLTPYLLRLYLDTSIDFWGASGPVLMRDIKYMGWEYEDQTSLETVINEMIQIVITRGLLWFDVASVPIPEVTTQREEILLDESVSRADNFAIRYNLSIIDETSVNVLEDLIRKRKEQSVSEEWKFLLDAGAYLGEFIRKHLGGQWGWNEEERIAIVYGIGGKTKLAIGPLTIVVHYWFRNPFFTLQGTYESLIEAVNNPYRYV